MAGFLETTALVADSDQLPGEGEDSGKVTMMTLHTAKGLEYPYVFLTGMEQGTFPHQRAMEDTSELSEERRLAYVGITRAKRRLYVTRAAVRAQWGQANDMMPSQFLDEIPDELIDWKRREAGVERMRASWGDDDEFGGWTMMTISDPLPSANRCTDRRHTVPHRMVLVLADRIPLMGRLMDRTARMVPDGPPTAREAAVSLADRTLARPHTVRMAHPGRHTVPASPPANPVRSPRAAPSQRI